MGSSNEFDILDAVHPWYLAGEPFALATVVGTFRSAPRPPGAAMAVSASGVVVGSVSGGCVEGAVYEEAREVLMSERRVLRTYGVSDDDAFEAGLTCGGTLQIFVEPVSRRSFPELPDVMGALKDGEPVAVATVVAGPDSGPGGLGRRLVVWPDRASGTLGSVALDRVVTVDVRGLLEQGTTTLRHYSPAGRCADRAELADLDDLAVFVRSFVPPPRLLVFGAIDFAAAVAELGAFLGYRVTVCDARPVFATAERFPHADEVVVRWPHDYLTEEAAAGRLDDRTVVTVLTHDPKFDVPLLTVALRLPQLAYVGALGSRRTQRDRLARLREVGLDDQELARLSAPAGLDLGARTPQETAVSIAAEIIAARWGGTGRPLARGHGPIHTAIAPDESGAR
ncbi:xanthine dehydrogenase accessory factor [Kitasatospora sp. MAP12-15]|uniref:XdhC family protein n=1 Tax=unclassified Kitasatospora TaxID=2633591 RepID=UPI002473CAD9|nr:XdhC family protein [Kitasatospora sp. MAP12-44]MDH6114572.1 xanthine dehydrogenase accessory factor [Kitasatospora sp. MAP12-44]